MKKKVYFELVNMNRHNWRNAMKLLIIPNSKNGADMLKCMQ